MDTQIIPQFDDSINEYVAVVPETGAEVFGATAADCAARLAEARRVAQAHAQKSPQDSRAAKARAILDAGLISPNGSPRCFYVRSQSDPGTCYTVDLRRPSCSCPDFQKRGADCKHVIAARLFDKLPDRIDFITAGDEVIVTKFRRIYREDGPADAPESSEAKTLDMDAALAWCEAHGYTVRRWTTGARAWKGKPWPIRTRTQIQRRRQQAIAEATHAARHGIETNFTSLDFAFEG